MTLHKEVEKKELFVYCEQIYFCVVYIYLGDAFSFKNPDKMVPEAN